MALTSKVESYVTYNEHQGLDVRKIDGYVTYAKSSEKRMHDIVISASGNGSWMDNSTISFRGNDGLDNSSIYRIFNGGWSDYLNKFNEDSYIDICFPNTQQINFGTLSSSDGYLPETGEIYYSDDGNVYTKCSSWSDTDKKSKSANFVIDNNVGAHRIWRFLSTSRAIVYPTKNADVSEIKLQYQELVTVDNTLPEGMGGIVNAYAVYNEHFGLDIRKLEVYVTYKEHDNSFDGDVTLNGLQIQEVPDSGYYLPLNLTVLQDKQPVIKNLAVVPTDIDTEKNVAYITLDDGTKLTYPLHKKS